MHMKVLLVCGIYTDGKTNISSQFVHHQAIALKKHGIDVAVLSLDTRSIRRKRKHGFNKYVIDDIPVYVGSFPCGPLGEILKFVSVKLANKLFKIIVREQGLPDIIHGHFYYNSYSITEMANKYNIPLVTTEHSSTVLEMNVTDKIKKDAKYVYEQSVKIICVSDGLKRAINSFYDGEVKVINNIVSNNFQHVACEKNKEFTFVSTGNLIQLKRHDITLNAFEEFTKKHPNSKLIIIGQGDLKANLIKTTKTLGISQKVEFKGRVENKELPQIYSRCHSFVLPSEYETFGVAYIEAIAAGLPVISSKHGKLNGIVNEKNGIAIEENTVENVFQAMEYIYKNYEEFDKEKMSRDVIERYSEEKIVEEIFEIYKLLQAQRRSV